MSKGWEKKWSAPFKKFIPVKGAPNLFELMVLEKKIDETSSSKDISVRNYFVIRGKEEWCWAIWLKYENNDHIIFHQSQRTTHFFWFLSARSSRREKQEKDSVPIKSESISSLCGSERFQNPREYAQPTKHQSRLPVADLLQLVFLFCCKRFSTNLFNKNSFGNIICL